MAVMNRILLDPTTVTKLGTLIQATELCDESGRTLGYFCPTDSSQYEGVVVPISDEELRRREQEVGGFTTAELLNRLDSLARRENG